MALSTSDKVFNGEILASAREKLKGIKEAKRISKKDRVFAEVLDLIVMFMQEDHPKTKQMYSTYRPMVIVGMIAITAIVTGLATGKISISFSP